VDYLVRLAESGAVITAVYVIEVAIIQHTTMSPELVESRAKARTPRHLLRHLFAKSDDKDPWLIELASRGGGTVQAGAGAGPAGRLGRWRERRSTQRHPVVETVVLVEAYPLIRFQSGAPGRRRTLVGQGAGHSCGLQRRGVRGWAVVAQFKREEREHWERQQQGHRLNSPSTTAPEDGGLGFRHHRLLAKPHA
jgi:hypothetical protein